MRWNNFHTICFVLKQTVLPKPGPVALLPIPTLCGRSFLSGSCSNPAISKCNNRSLGAHGGSACTAEVNVVPID